MTGFRRDDSGAAMVEFIALAVTVAVPLVYVLLAAFDVQREAYGATTAVREAGRAFVRAPDSTVGEQRARMAAGLALADHGLPLDPSALRVECSAAPCLTPGATITVRLDAAVPLPLVPRVLGAAPATIPVHATHVEVVDRFREPEQTP